MARHYRHFTLDRAKVKKEDRTISMVFSSEYPVPREDEEEGEYDEVLSHDEADADLSRLKDGAPLLEMHDLNKQRGVIESAELGDLDGQRVGRATARFSKNDDADKIFQDVQDGIRKHVSVGYELTKVLGSQTVNGRRQVRFAWMPYEISVVSAPEDPHTGIGRGLRALMHQDTALKTAVTAVETLLAQGQGLSERTQSNLKVFLTAAEACLANFSPGAADVCFEESYQALCDVRGLSGELAQQAGTALSAANECCWQVLCSGSRSVDAAKLAKRAKLKNDMPTEVVPPTNAPAAPSAAAILEIENRSRDAERNRVKKINAALKLVSDNFPQGAEQFRALATKHIDENLSPDDFNAALLPIIPGVKKINPITCRSLGMNEEQTESYSLGRAIKSVIENNGKIGGLEGEIHQEMMGRGIGVSPQGFWVPHDALIRTRAKRHGRRDLTVGTFGQGGAFVATIIQTPIIEILRNRMVCDRLGVQSLSGLQGNVAIPRQTGAATAYALPETQTLTKSNQAIDQIILNPHRVGAWNDYSKQLLLQSSVDVENFIRDDLMKVLAIKWDYLILQGAGANSEPTGILNTQGIGSVLFGATTTWSKVVAFETALALANADAGNMAYVTTPNVRGAWKTIAKIGTTFPVFIWDVDATRVDDSNDGNVNGYRAAVTNQILNSLVFFGNWEDAIGPAMWGGYDLIVNPYSRDTDGVVRVTVNTYGDVAVRHAASFCVSADSGNQ